MNSIEKKDIIAKMKEEDFKAKLLIPLFYQMGFQEVIDFHGGILEKGKVVADV